jgi:hypothetical protein
VAPSALVTLCSFHAAASAVLLLDPNCTWVPEVGGDVGRMWGSVYDLVLAQQCRTALRGHSIHVAPQCVCV